MAASEKKAVRALGLCSGGLDSMLAGLVLKQQDVDVAWITFETPFFSAGKARAAARQTGIPLTVREITPAYLEMLRNPPCGYGRFMNPCMDCHALMFRLAGEWMRTQGFDFLFSGEVVGQRPMSQTKSSLRYVEKHSGFEGYILRPLSARNLPATIPEKEGWVERERLLDLSGRSRKSQIKLAAEFGIKEYPAPAGGCLLTDPGYARRLKDLFAHQAETSVADLELLKHGRHFRLDAATKIIVGRTQQDNQRIQDLHLPDRETTLKVRDFPGPVVAVRGRPSAAILHQAAAICAGYSKASGEPVVEVLISGPDGQKVLETRSIPPDEARAFII
ncbi:MAG: tRNA 4-thiouridine(8) synthase ThiI [Desulfobacterales bacterium]|nr:tRNA 4-thiouridine(8) synthase ThiI [Desulfobacterales bacterium]MDJ0887586.1 tRNA 4-thiouridine(8) synthase ThiI [Desulfobacterales bacterium]